MNHPHFFSRITHTDWKFLWQNNLLLFWLAIVPFTTAWVGVYPAQPLVVCVYVLTVCLAGIVEKTGPHALERRSEQGGQSSAAVIPATRTAVETPAWLIEQAFGGDPDHSILGSLRDLPEESWTSLLQRALGRVRSAGQAL